MSLVKSIGFPDEIKGDFTAADGGFQDRLGVG